MPVPTLTAILKRILKQPTAPFHEYHVREEIEKLLRECPGVKLKRDKFGNLLATYKHGRHSSRPTWVLGAHMDHPGFVKREGGKGADAWEFLGGVGAEVVASGVKAGLRKAKGRVAAWSFPVEIGPEKISAGACDDLVGCAVIIATFYALSQLKLQCTVHAAFTRAEEVGFLGAWHLGQNWPFGGAVFLSLETSRPVNGAVLGGGPVIRVGDRMSVFDSEAISILMKTASEQGIRVQRCLLDAGACEATAMQACGHRSAGISVPMGNYHNTSEQRKLAAEFVMMSDVKALVSLLTALVATKHEGIGERTIRERVEMRMEEYKTHLAESKKLFL